jgi:hypothetical protein
MPRIGVPALVLLLLATRAGAAWECRTAHFRVIGELGPEVTRAAAEHLEAVRQRFDELGLPRPREARGPVLVLVFADQRSLHPYAPGDSRDPVLTRGLSLDGEEQDWIALAWETSGIPQATLAHEYAHLVRDAASDPLWFREGLAEYLAGLRLDPGAPVPGPTAPTICARCGNKPGVAGRSF